MPLRRAMHVRWRERSSSERATPVVGSRRRRSTAATVLFFERRTSAEESEGGIDPIETIEAPGRDPLTVDVVGHARGHVPERAPQQRVRDDIEVEVDRTVAVIRVE